MQRGRIPIDDDLLKLDVTLEPYPPPDDDDNNDDDNPPPPPPPPPPTPPPCEFTIEGPKFIAVGESATYTLSIGGADEVEWMLAPAQGVVQVDSPTLTELTLRRDGPPDARDGHARGGGHHRRWRDVHE